MHCKSLHNHNGEETRKRASLKGKDATKVRVVKDPNPDSEDFMYDAIDKFHNGEEKIMLNPNEEEVNIIISFTFL